MTHRERVCSTSCFAAIQAGCAGCTCTRAHVHTPSLSRPHARDAGGRAICAHPCARSYVRRCVRIEAAALHPSVRVPTSVCLPHVCRRLLSPTCTNRANGVHTRKSTWQVSNAFTRKPWTRTERSCTCVYVRMCGYVEKRAHTSHTAPSIVVVGSQYYPNTSSRRRVRRRFAGVSVSACISDASTACTPTRAFWSNSVERTWLVLVVVVVQLFCWKPRLARISLCFFHISSFFHLRIHHFRIGSK